MKITYKKTIFTLIFSMILVSLLYIFYNFFWFSTITFSGSENFVRIDINEYSYSGAELETISEIKFRPGTLEVKAYSPINKTFDETFNLVPLSGLDIVLPKDTVSEKDITSSLSKDFPNEYDEVNGRLLENNWWFVLEAKSSSKTAEGFASIYRFDTMDWYLFDTGTGFDINYMRETGFPESVIKHMEESRE